MIDGNIEILMIGMIWCIDDVIVMYCCYVCI